jgi:hypothetical protein
MSISFFANGLKLYHIYSTIVYKNVNLFLKQGYYYVVIWCQYTNQVYMVMLTVYLRPKICH